MSLLSCRRNADKLQRLPSRHGESSSGNSLGLSCPNSPAVKKSYRLVVVGSCRTGKSSIIDRFLDRDFDERYNPTIENFHRKLYRVRGEVHQLDIVDCSGNDPFPAARKLCYLSGDMFLIVGSVDIVSSIEAMVDLSEQIVECKSNHMSQRHQVPIVFAFNKVDLPESRWQLSREEVVSRLTQLDYSEDNIIECSASQGTHIDKLFGRVFQLGRCPKHMNPELHKMLRNELSADVESKPSKHILQRMKSRFSKDGEDDLAVYTDVNARRPSLRTDLLVNRAKYSHQQQHSLSIRRITGDTGPTRDSKCSIQ